MSPGPLPDASLVLGGSVDVVVAGGADDATVDGCAATEVGRGVVVAGAVVVGTERTAVDVLGPVAAGAVVGAVAGAECAFATNIPPVGEALRVHAAADVPAA